ncbi:MAG: response regulator [Lachnospiraceae bacterium]|nr:response regulator [Lachnospiraceae bacterium]
MAVSQIIIESILFAILLITISVTYKDKNTSRDDEGSVRFMMLVNAYAVGLICYIIIYLMGDSQSAIRYGLYIIVWFSYIAVLAAMITLSIYVFDYKGLWIRRITSLLIYYSMFAALVELFFNKFKFEGNMTGLEFTPYAISKFFYYAIPIIVYNICMLFIMNDYHKNHSKIRERHLLKLGAGAIVPSFVGLIAESICHVFLDIRYPVFYIFMIISIKLMSDMHLHSRSSRLYRDDFKEFLRDDNTDAVFICDDEFTVLYENKAADINSVMYRDNYTGKKLTDIFVIDPDVRRALSSKDAREGLMVPAIYTVTDRKLVLSVEYIYDICDEILCSIITIPNYMVAMNVQDFRDEEETSPADKTAEQVKNLREAGIVDKEESLPSIHDLRSIDSNTHILLVDEDEGNLNSYEELLKPYNIVVKRAASGRIALEMMQDPCYDAVFIANDMKKLNGVETAKRIRGMEGDYYNDVPIIFILSEPVVNVYKDLLEVSFNDFLETPLSIKKLNAIMTRWLWRRYAVTDKYNGTSGSTRVVRSMDALAEIYNDCIAFNKVKKYSYIGYSLKGMKRLCARLENKHLINACDKLIEIYIRGQYDQLEENLEAFHSELDRLRNSSGFGMIY